MAAPSGGGSPLIGVTVLGGAAVAASMKVSEEQIEAGLRRQVYRHGELLRSAVRARASGRPGPRVQTGDYRRGIAVNHGMAPSPRGRGLVPASTVRSNSPQAWRLERGFVGADALGRVYNQPAYEHWGPAIDAVEPRLYAALEAEWAKADAAGIAASRAATRRVAGQFLRRGL